MGRTMTIALPAPAPMRPLSRNAVAIAAVLLLHGAALWALQHRLVQRTVENIADIRASDEGREGIQSFLGKRKPNWLLG